MRKFIIDTDTASDDAVALVMALRYPDIEVLAVTIVSGNVDLDQGTRNALFTIELCGMKTPVYRGARRPLLRDPVFAHFFHGSDGMGGQNYPEPVRQAEEGHAADVLVETILSNPGIVVVTLGPLTNLALALLRAPEIASKVSRCVVMGGAACTVGNVTPAAEYNLWVDPEAARIVFHSGLPIEMVGWELCRHEANLDKQEMERMRQMDTPLAHFTLDCNRTAIEANHRQSGDPGLALPDPVAMSIAINPAVCLQKSAHFVEIETTSELTRGMTVVDALGVGTDERNQSIWAPLLRGGPNAEVCWKIDIPAWKAMLFEAVQ